jgi:hypothetical protein
VFLFVGRWERKFLWWFRKDLVSVILLRIHTA